MTFTKDVLRQALLNISISYLSDEIKDKLI